MLLPKRAFFFFGQLIPNFPRHSTEKLAEKSSKKHSSILSSKQKPIKKNACVFIARNYAWNVDNEVMLYLLCFSLHLPISQFCNFMYFFPEILAIFEVFLWADASPFESFSNIMINLLFMLDS